LELHLFVFGNENIFPPVVCPLPPDSRVNGPSSLTSNDNGDNGNDGKLLDVCMCCCDGGLMDDSLRQMTMNTAHTGRLQGQGATIWDNNYGALVARQSGKTMMAPCVIGHGIGGKVIPAKMA
jgi:hypothetical protein